MAHGVTQHAYNINSWYNGLIHEVAQPSQESLCWKIWWKRENNTYFMDFLTCKIGKYGLITKVLGNFTSHLQDVHEYWQFEVLLTVLGCFTCTNRSKPLKYCHFHLPGCTVWLIKQVRLGQIWSDYPFFGEFDFPCAIYTWILTFWSTLGSFWSHYKE